MYGCSTYCPMSQARTGVLQIFFISLMTLILANNKNNKNVALSIFSLLMQRKKMQNKILYKKQSVIRIFFFNIAYV